MTVRVAINGLGRIGRDVLRCMSIRGGGLLQVVAVNDLAPADTLGNLLRHDSIYGSWRADIEVDRDGDIVIGGRVIATSAERDPGRLPWRELRVDIVVEATGKFRGRPEAAGHLANGARKVLLTAPGRDVDATIVLGVNDEDYDPLMHHVVSNASCTTHCAAPMLHVLHRAFGIRRGLLTAVHSYTNDQYLLDGPHRDPRRARSAAVNIIPTSTSAVRTVGEVIPALLGRLDGVAVRVPVEAGSLADLTVELDEPATVGQVNRVFADAATGYLKNIVRYTEEPLVSRDIIGDPASCVVDASLTRVQHRLIKVFGWYDNEWGYANRTVDLLEKMAGPL